MEASTSRRTVWSIGSVDAATFNALATPPWQSLIACACNRLAPECAYGKGDGRRGDMPKRRRLSPRGSGGQRSILSADPNWQCYRYRDVRNDGSLRNWIWTIELTMNKHSPRPASPARHRAASGEPC